MNKKETVALFGLIAALFPRDEKFTHPDATMRDAWAEMLADIPFDHAKAAIKASVATSPFPPSIAEIRDYATRLNGPRRITAEEAWGLASDAIRTYGLNLVKQDGFVEKPVVESTHEYGGRTYKTVTYQPTGLEYEAKRHVPPEVWDLMKHFGYRDMYLSENPDVVRGQFMRAWNGHNEEEKERRVMGNIIPELFQTIAGTALGQAWFSDMLPDGGDD